MNPNLRSRGATIRITTEGRTLRHIPLGDLILQTELRVATEHNIQSYPCPCKDCHGGRRKRIHVIREHHSSVGRDPFLTKSIIGGDPLDGYPPRGIWVEDIAYDDDVVHIDPLSVVDNDAGTLRNDITEDTGAEPTGDSESILDQFHDVQRQVLEALGRCDYLHTESVREPNVPENEHSASDTMDGLDELYKQATIPLYTGSKTSVISATIIIINMCVVFRVSNKFTDELLRYLSEDLLPEGNKLPGSHAVARKTIRRLGLNYNNIHACPDGCVLYEDDLAELNECPKCSKSRWMEGTSSIAAKVIRHFPLIPRVKRMWRSPEIAQMLTGYTKHVSSDSVM